MSESDNDDMGVGVRVITPEGLEKTITEQKLDYPVLFTEEESEYVPRYCFTVAGRDILGGDILIMNNANNVPLDNIYQCFLDILLRLKDPKSMLEIRPDVYFVETMEPPMDVIKIRVIKYKHVANLMPDIKRYYKDPVDNMPIFVMSMPDNNGNFVDDEGYDDNLIQFSHAMDISYNEYLKEISPVH